MGMITECDPICALQACMEGFQVATMEQVVGEIDIFVSTTGNFQIITLEHMKEMKNNAIVGNIGHFDNEIEMAELEGFPGIKVENIKPQVDRFFIPGWTRHHCACIRKAVESRLCDWPPIFRDVLLFYKPGACSVRPLEESERDQGLQERCVPVAEESRRESGEIAFARTRCYPHASLKRASGLHWC